MSEEKTLRTEDVSGVLKECLTAVKGVVAEKHGEGVSMNEEFLVNLGLNIYGNLIAPVFSQEENIKALAETFSGVSDYAQNMTALALTMGAGEEKASQVAGYMVTNAQEGDDE